MFYNIIKNSRNNNFQDNNRYENTKEIVNNSNCKVVYYKLVFSKLTTTSDKIKYKKSFS